MCGGGKSSKGNQTSFGSEGLMQSEKLYFHLNVPTRFLSSKVMEIAWENTFAIA